jgi:hypothetical protein
MYAVIFVLFLLCVWLNAGLRSISTRATSSGLAMAHRRYRHPGSRLCCHGARDRSADPTADRTARPLWASPGGAGAMSVRDPHNIVHDLPQRDVVQWSIPCRGRRRYRRRITTQHHEREKPSNCPLAVCVGANPLGDAAGRDGLGLDLSSIGAQSSALGFEVGQG